MTAHDAYKSLISHFKENTTLASVNSVLEWDQDTYMPSAGVDHRSEQMSLIGRMVHERDTDPRINDWLSACESSELVKDPLSVEAVNVREWRRMYDLETKLPSELVEEIIRTTTKARQVWMEARKKSDFAMFAPWLEKNVELNLRKADALGYEGERYDALLDAFEPHAKTAEVTKVFEGLRKDLVPLVAKIKDAPKRPDIGVIKRPYDVKKQAIFAEMVSQRIGYDFNSGRLDITTHPFCAGLGPSDTRICTRWYPEDLAEGTHRHDPRNRPRPLRHGPRPRPLRHADGGCGVVGDSRIAVADVGKSGRTLARFLGILLPDCEGRLPR
jgi:carboxypeptidase Taq